MNNKLADLEIVFHETLDKEPNDWVTRMALADYLEENNRQDEAKLQRWLIENKRCPLNRVPPNNDIWDWWGIPQNYFFTGTSKDKEYACLPKPLYGLCNNSGVYSNRQTAETDLLRVLKKLEML